jgi:hypothetical protein
MIKEEKLKAIRNLSIDLKSNQRLIIELQDQKPPGGTYDKNVFINFKYTSIYFKYS